MPGLFYCLRLPLELFSCRWGAEARQFAPVSPRKLGLSVSMEAIATEEQL